MTATTKAIDLDEFFPKYLGSRQEKARLALLGQPGLIFKAYDMTGSYKYLNIKTKRMLSVENKSLLKIHKVTYPWIVTIHHKDKINDEIQLHNVETEQTKRSILTLGEGETCNVVLCNGSGILIVTEKQFYFINYATFGEDKPRTIALSSTKLLEKASNQFSSIEDNKALIATGWQFQLWDIETGKCLTTANLEREEEPMPFQLLSLRDGVVIGSTLKKLYIWAESGLNSIQLRDPCSCFIIDGGKLYTASITGQISVHEFPKGTFVLDLNIGAAAGMNFLEQMQNSRVNDLVYIDEVLFAITENGELQAWNTNLDQSSAPLKAQNLKGKARKMIKLDGKIYVLVVRKGKHEELVLYQPNVKRLLATNVAVSVASSTPSVAAGEVRKDGYLVVKAYDAKKGKRRYVQLRDNILYEYSSPNDIAPLGTYVMSPTASIEITTSKKSKQGFTKLHLNDKQFITLTSENAVEEDEWYKALNASIKDLKFSSFSYAVPFASIQLVKDERGNVVKLGKGAESLVVRGLLHNRDVAVKLFNQNTPSRIFKNEIEILSALRHPCIMELVGSCVKQPNLALIQPLMMRGSLYDALHGSKKVDPTKYTWKLYLKIANDIASAMNYLHNFTLNNVKQPIIHRDLKPSNLLVNSLDVDSNAVTVKLTDFGISAFGAKTENSSSGTTAYMAPEVQERGESVTKSDVYSFGIVLWEMLTQSVPPTVKRVPNEHARSIVPSTFPERAPAELVSLIRECTSVSPNMRPTFESIIERLMECTVAMISNNRINDSVMTTSVSATPSSSSGLVIPNKLYGREPEVKSVLKAFDRFKNGAKEILFIKGYAGIGKSSFIEKMSQYASTRGYVCSGKWTQQQRRIPYFAITQALSGLLNTKSKTWTQEEKLNWKNKFLYVFEETSRRVLFELVPEAKKIVHDTESIDSDDSGSGPDMANISKDKFNYTLVTFFKMLATSEHPLILALDDLQWADSASFDLITALFTDPSLKYLLLVGTYRDNEISTKHGLLNALQDINAAHITSVVEVRLAQLQSDSVFKLLCDTFKVSADNKSERSELQELANIVTTKTFGNPFFIHQFLQSLFLDNLITVNTQGNWSWNLKEIKASKATDNVSGIVTKNINGLSKKAIQLLRLASHLTSTFTSKVLAVLSGVQADTKSLAKPSAEEVKSIEEVLLEAVRKGLLFMKSKHTYKFEHDEIQQVLYAMLDKNEKQATHYAIGRAFNKIIHSSNLAKSFPTITLFETVHQLNSGADLIKDRAEFIQLAQLNLDASKVAIHKMIAFESAYGFLQAAMKYMELEKGKGAGEKAHWSVNYELCYSIYFELLHCEINQGLLDDAEATIEYLFQKVDNKNKLQKARLYEMKVHLQESKYQPLEACQTALDCLNYLGVLPEKTIVFALLQNPAPVFALAQQVDASKISQAELRARAARTFIQQVTPEVDLANRVLLTAMVSAILSGIVPVSSLFSLLWMKLMFENPGLKVSPYALFVYSSYCINFRGDMNTAVDLTRLAYNLLQDSNDPHRAIALLNTSTYLGFRMHPYKEVLASMNKVYQMATEDGAFASVGYACIHEVYIMVMGGENVSQAIVKAEKWKLLMLAKRNFFIVFGINISLAILKLLRGDTLHNDTLTFEGFNQEDTERGLAHMPPVAVFSYLVYKMFAKCLFNRWEEAYEIQKRIISECENPIKGFLFYAFWLFLAALVPLKLYKKNVTSKTKRHEYSTLFDDYTKRLQEYEMGGQNIQHWLDLLRAEELANSFYRHSKRVSKVSASAASSASLNSSSSADSVTPSPQNSSPSLTRKDAQVNLKDRSEKSHLKYLEATHYYNKSKEHAANVGSFVFAGWAAEFCADFCTDLGWESMTRVYAYDALKLYEEASASSKVEHIKSNYEDILAEFTKVIITTTDSSNNTDEYSVNPHSIILLKQFGRNLLSQVKNETKNANLRDAIDVYSDYITSLDLAVTTSDTSDLSSASSMTTMSTSLETSRSTEIQVEKELLSTLSMVKLIQQVSHPEIDITHSISLLIPGTILLPLLLTPTNFKEIITIYTVAFMMNFNAHSKYHMALFIEPSAELRIVFQLTDFALKEASAPLQGEITDVPVGVKNSLRPIEQILESVQAEFNYCRVVRDQNIHNVLKMTCAFHASEK